MSSRRRRSGSVAWGAEWVYAHAPGVTQAVSGYAVLCPAPRCFDRQTTAL
jgi:hypothetical protein